MIEKATKADYKIAQYNILINKFETIYEGSENVMLDHFTIGPITNKRIDALDTVISFMREVSERINVLQSLRDKHER